MTVAKPLRCLAFECFALLCCLEEWLLDIVIDGGIVDVSVTTTTAITITVTTNTTTPITTTSTSSTTTPTTTMTLLLFFFVFYFVVLFRVSVCFFSSHLKRNVGTKDASN